MMIFEGFLLAVIVAAFLFGREAVKETAKDWQNRIVSQGSKPASQFAANPLNFRKHPQHQRDAVKGSLSELGWIQNVIESARSGNLIDGHERVWQALQNGDAEVPYIQVDLSPEEERLALAILDPISALAETDKDQLDALLREVQTGDAALQKMLAELAAKNGLYPDGVTDPLAEWQGMPEFESGPRALKQVLIYLRDPAAITELGRLIGQDLTEATKSFWFPEKPETGAD